MTDHRWDATAPISLYRKPIQGISQFARLFILRFPVVKTARQWIENYGLYFLLLKVVKVRRRTRRVPLYTEGGGFSGPLLGLHATHAGPGKQQLVTLYLQRPLTIHTGAVTLDWP